MPEDAPKYAPTVTPKRGEQGVDGWQAHWLQTYHEPRLVWHRNKWHWAVTKPKELQKKTDKDKKLSSGTTDKLIAKQRKWSVVAKIYASFDAQLGDIDPQVTRDELFRLEAIKLFARYGLKTDPIKQLITGRAMETDDIVRLAHAHDISVPDEMIDLLNEESKFYLTYLPSMAEPTEADKAAERIFGTQQVNRGDMLNEMAESLEYLRTNPNAEDAKLIRRSIKELTVEFAKHSPKEVFTEKDKELAERLTSGTSRVITSTLSEVSKRYISENEWNRERTKSGAKLALERFSELHGNDTDILEINAKHAYAFAKWMEDELDAANKSIKAAISYVKGMFSWAITQIEYDITEEPWGGTKTDREIWSYSGGLAAI